MRDLIYQIYPRSFKDSNGDGVGDIKGILEKVDYIASLGCDYVWISPFFKSPMKDYGYDVSDYRAVDPVFGTNEDFYKLIKALDKRGVKVMVDFVAAHTSDQHAWFQESRQSRDNPKADWYVWKDPQPDGSPPNNWLSVFAGSAWQWEPRRQQYYLRQFLVEQPCLNHYNPAVHREVIDTMKFWLDKGVRGFRIDAIQYAHFDPKFRDNPANPAAKKNRNTDIFSYQKIEYSAGRKEGLPVIKDMRKLADKYPGTLLLGEVLHRGMARMYTGPDLLHCCYFGDLGGLKGLEGKALGRMLGDIYGQFPQGDFCWSMDCHDNWRHMTRLRPDQKYADAFAAMTAALFLSLPGGYSMYQGEELGLPSAELSFDQLVDPFDRMLYPHHYGRDTSRTPLPWAAKEKQAGFSKSKTTWLPVDPAQAKLAVDGQERNKASVLHKVRAIVAWRKKHLEDGARYAPLKAEEGVFAFTRGGHRFVFNLTNKPKTAKGFKGLKAAAISEGALDASGAVKLPPYGFVIAG